MADDFLNETVRAEDILLGALGIDGDARIVSIKAVETGYQGTAEWPDGERVEFESDDELSDLERWALGVLEPLGEEAA